MEINLDELCRVIPGAIAIYLGVIILIGLITIWLTEKK